jgi:hypothetical protein
MHQQPALPDPIAVVPVNFDVVDGLLLVAHDEGFHE